MKDWSIGKQAEQYRKTMSQPKENFKKNTLKIYKIGNELVFISD